MFFCTIFIWPCDLDLRPVYLGDVWWINLHTSNAFTNISASFNYPFLSYVWLKSDHITITWNGHCACAVSRDLSPGSKNYPNLWNPWPQFVYLLCHFQGTTTKIKPCYRQKIAFFFDCEGYKVYCACAVSRDLCIGVPPKLHVKIFWPRIISSLYNFYGATMTIKGSLYRSTPMLNQFSAAKKTVQSKSVPKWRFFINFTV